MVMAISADPVRFAIWALRNAGFTAVEPQGPGASLPDYPYFLVKAAPGDADEDFIPRGNYSVDLLSYSEKTAEMRRMAFRAFDTFKQLSGETVATAGRLIAARCSVAPFMAYDNRDNLHYFVQTWDLELAHITGVD